MLRRSVLCLAWLAPLLASCTFFSARKSPDRGLADEVCGATVVWTLSVVPIYDDGFRWVEVPLRPQRWENGRWIADF